jgi:hypothetical protein
MSTAQLAERAGAPGKVDLFHLAGPSAGVRGA